MKQLVISNKQNRECDGEMWTVMCTTLHEVIFVIVECEWHVPVSLLAALALAAAAKDRLS